MSHGFPVCSADELAKISLKFEDASVGSRLREVLDEHGLAIVDLLSPEECAEFESLFGQDLAAVRDASKQSEAVGTLAEALAATDVPASM